MRTLLIALSLLLLVSPLVYSQQQYTEGACIMLQQQIDRFSHQKQNSNYRSAKREYDRFCRKPTSMAQREMRASDYTAVAKPAPAAQPTAAQSDANQRSASPKSVSPAGDTATATPVVQAVAAETSSELTSASELAAAVSAEPAGVTPAVTQAATETLAETTEVVPAAAVAVAEMPVTVPEPELVTADTVAPVEAVAATADTVNRTPPAQSATDSMTWFASYISYEELLMQILTNMPLIAANIFAGLLAIFLLTSWFGLNLPGFKGVFAEYKLNRLLRWRLSAQYQHFRKLKLLTAKDELIVVDHLVLSPFGIFVIAVKSDRGRISGSETLANWTRQYFGKNKQLMNPLHQNFKNVEAVKQLLQLQGAEALRMLHSVAAFSRVAQFDSAMPANVTYVDAAAAYLKQFTEPCLTEEQQQRFAALLRQASTEH